MHARVLGLTISALILAYGVVGATAQDSNQFSNKLNPTPRPGRIGHDGAQFLCGLDGSGNPDKRISEFLSASERTVAVYHGRMNWLLLVSTERDHAGGNVN